MLKILRWIANLLISGFIIWGASKVFPEKVVIEDFKTLVIATISIWIINILINIAAALMLGGGLVLDGCGCCWLVLGLFILAFSKIITLWCLDTYLPGFIMEGFWLKVLVAFLCSIFTISAPRRADPYDDPNYDYYRHHDYDPRY